MLQVDIDKITPVTEARDNLNKIIEEVDNSDVMHVLTKNGTPVAVIVGVNHLEKLTGQPLEGGTASTPAAATASSSSSSDDDKSDAPTSKAVEAPTDNVGDDKVVPASPAPLAVPDIPSAEKKPADLPKPASFLPAEEPKPMPENTSGVGSDSREVDGLGSDQKDNQAPAPASLPGAVPAADSATSGSASDDLFSDFDDQPVAPATGASTDNKSIFSDDELPTPAETPAPSNTAPAPSDTSGVGSDSREVGKVDSTTTPPAPANPVVDPMVPATLATPEAEDPDPNPVDTPLAATAPAATNENSDQTAAETSTLPVNTMNYNDFIAPPDDSGSTSLNTPVPETATPPVADAMATPPVVDDTQPVVTGSQTASLETPAEEPATDSTPDLSQVNPNLAHPNYSFDENPPTGASSGQNPPAAQPPVDLAA